MKNNEKNIVKGIIAGAIGGMVAAFVMSEFQNLTEKIMPVEGKKSLQAEPANIKAAEAISEKVFDYQLTKSEKAPAGEAVHYLVGGISGAIYGATAEMSGVTTIGAGLPFGSVVWSVADEVVAPALGLMKSPTQQPLSVQAQSLTSHWVYGLVTELVRKQVRKVL